MLTGDTDIRFYDSNGAMTASYNHAGEGPGELTRGVDVIAVGNDSVWVADDRVREFLVLDGAGRFIRSVTLPALPATPEASAVLDGGVTVHVIPRPIDSGAGFKKRFVDVLVYDSSGRRRDSLGVRHHGYRGLVEGDIPLIVPGWFDGETHLASRGSEVAVGSGTEPAVQNYRWNGDEATLKTIIHWTPIDRTVGDEHVEAYMADWQSRSPDPGSDFAVAIRDGLMHTERPIPDTFPEHHQLLYGHDGTLWVQRFTAPGDETEAWLAFDGSGIFECILTLPDFREVAAFGADFVLVLEDLDNGLQTVARYPLRR